MRYYALFLFALLLSACGSTAPSLPVDAEPGPPGPPAVLAVDAVEALKVATGQVIVDLQQDNQALLDELAACGRVLREAKASPPLRFPRTATRTVTRTVADGSLTAAEERALQETRDAWQAQCRQAEADLATQGQQARDALARLQAELAAAQAPLGGQYGTAGLLGAVLTILSYVLGRITRRKTP